MAVVRLEIKTRQPLTDSRKFDHVGCYEQLDGTAHLAVDPAHRLNCAITDIDLAERGRDGLVHFTADVRILAPADQARGNHRLLFDVPNRGNRLAFITSISSIRRSLIFISEINCHGPVIRENLADETDSNRRAG